VAHVLSEWNFADTVRSTRHAAQNVRIEGRSWEYPHFLDEPLERGRDFTRAEDRRRASVAILGSEIAEALFPGESALGRSVRIADRPFDVIGVMRPRGALLGQSQDKYVIVPIGAAIKTWGRPQGEIGIAVKPTSPADLEACADEVHTILRAHRGLRPSQEDPFELLTAAAYLKMYRRSTRAIYGALIGLVALALVVGGIVIANVMLMVVTQRTREIGIRKAVGARRGHILTQFLVESATLSLAGGLAGFALGAAVTALVDAVTPLTFRIQPWSVALGFGLVLLVGALAGLYPAARAAALDPIAALRQER
ncbi:MAG: ABC transporter permease, partial [Planctomycetes bacterium]|nr:ABC transporter permease [Planctomycetota bacterium]